MTDNVRQLCRDINNRVDDREKLQSLVVRLQEVLREERYETRVVKVAGPPDHDDPFDKILVA
ncbi:MAG TPA: hypothetical protein VNZ03_24930 [Terriglobales bacterium]|nr:hypothetical protein [Terriglobales bacterium]